MITIDEIRTMLVDIEDDRVERTISTTNTNIAVVFRDN